MKILITNDDGIDAEGLKVLARSLRGLKGLQVTVVAPERERSATSHSLTLHRPLRIIKRGKGYFAVDGTPTDSVMVGTSVILKTAPDLIVSGINRGGNLGDDVHYSGTVSAAMEGGIMGIPSVAVSQVGTQDKYQYTMAAQFTRKLVEVLKKHPLPKGIILNVNVPENVKTLACLVTKTGKRNYGDVYVKNLDPRGRPYYWIGGNDYSFQDIPGSDCNAITQGKISVTPISVNITSHSFIKEMERWKW